MPSSALYHEVPTIDDAGLSAADDSLADEKGGMLKKRHILWEHLKSKWWMVDVVFLAIIAALIVARPQPKLCLSDLFVEFTGDVTGFAPRCK